MSAIQRAPNHEVKEILPTIGLREVLERAPKEMDYLPYVRRQEMNHEIYEGFYLENAFIWLGYCCKDHSTGAGDIDLTWILPKGKIHLPRASVYQCSDAFNRMKSSIRIRGEFSSLDEFSQTLSTSALYVHQGELHAYQFGHGFAFGRSVQVFKKDSNVKSSSQIPPQSAWFEESLELLKLASTKYSYQKYVQDYLGRRDRAIQAVPKAITLST